MRVGVRQGSHNEEMDSTILESTENVKREKRKNLKGLLARWLRGQAALQAGRLAQRGSLLPTAGRHCHFSDPLPAHAHSSAHQLDRRRQRLSRAGFCGVCSRGGAYLAIGLRRAGISLWQPVGGGQRLHQRLQWAAGRSGNGSGWGLLVAASAPPNKWKAQWLEEPEDR